MSGERQREGMQVVLVSSRPEIHKEDGPFRTAMKEVGHIVLGTFQSPEELISAHNEGKLEEESIDVTVVFESREIDVANFPSILASNGVASSSYAYVRPGNMNEKERSARPGDRSYPGAEGLYDHVAFGEYYNPELIRRVWNKVAETIGKVPLADTVEQVPPQLPAGSEA